MVVGSLDLEQLSLFLSGVTKLQIPPPSTGPPDGLPGSPRRCARPVPQGRPATAGRHVLLAERPQVLHEGGHQELVQELQHQR